MRRRLGFGWRNLYSLFLVFFLSNIQCWAVDPRAIQLIPNLSLNEVTLYWQDEVMESIIRQKMAAISAGERPPIRIMDRMDGRIGYHQFDRHHTAEAYRRLGIQSVPAQYYSVDQVKRLGVYVPETHSKHLFSSPPKAVGCFTPRSPLAASATPADTPSLNGLFTPADISSNDRQCSSLARATGTRTPNTLASGLRVLGTQARLRGASQFAPTANFLSNDLPAIQNGLGIGFQMVDGGIASNNPYMTTAGTSVVMTTGGYGLMTGGGYLTSMGYLAAGTELTEAGVLMGGAGLTLGAATAAAAGVALAGTGVYGVATQRPATGIAPTGRWGGWGWAGYKTEFSNLYGGIFGY